MEECPMQIPNYGLLTGVLLDHSPQHGGNPHYQLFIKADGISYRVAVNLESTVALPDAPPELQFQVVPDLKKSDLAGAKALTGQVRNLNSFAPKGSRPDLPSLDFVRGGVLKMASFQTIPRGANPENNEFYQGLVSAAVKAKNNPHAFVAVFGTGFPANQAHGLHSSGGFSGVDNVHMNQGNFRRIDNQANRFFQENGPNQDGAVLFFQSDGTVQGFFAKFQSQDNETDPFGNPTHTGIAELDALPEAVRARHATRNRFASLSPISAGTRKPETHAGGAKHAAASAAPAAFVFAETSPDADPNFPFTPDDDSEVRNSPFVEQFAKFGVAEQVPGPRGGKYPTMKLADVLGDVAVNAIQTCGQIVFHAVGDTGAATTHVLSHEDSVAALMVEDFQAVGKERPAFFFHLGDVVYYYGEQQFYYEQFYRPYKKYPAPIFAIPGNHDGITYNQSMISLDAFQKAFCDDQPRHWEGAAGLSRTSMIQPGVFFTLDAPFVSIIGLYSNCSERYGYLDAQQKLFLFNELTRLKPLRANGQIAAILVAVHHPPLSFDPTKPSSAELRDAMDKAANDAGCWPDAVLSGHAHIYQRMSRTVPVGNANWQIPYIVDGSGGNFNVSQEIDKAGVKELDQSDSAFKLHRFLPHYGYLRITVRPMSGGANATLRIEFKSPDVNAGHPVADVCVLDLKTHQFVT
jgi:uncharacterized protein YukJ